MGKRSVNLQIIINYNLKYIANLHTFNYHIKKSRHIFNIHYFIQYTGQKGLKSAKKGPKNTIF